MASHGTATVNAQGQAAVDPPINAVKLITPTAIRDLLSHRHFRLCLALPGLNQPAASLESALMHLA